MPADRLAIVAIPLFSAAATLFLAITAWRRRKFVGRPATLFAVSMVAVAVYGFGYAMELSSDTLPAVLFWVRVEHLGIQLIAPTWLLFAVFLTGREKLFTPFRAAALFVIPALYLLAINSNEWIHLVYRNPRLVAGGPFLVFTFERGPLYWLNIAHISFCLAAATVLFALLLARSAPLFRRQAAVFFVGALVPWVGMGLFVSGNTPYNLDITPMTMGISGLLCALGIFEVRLLEVVPLARDFIFEGLTDGMLILDKQGRIVDFNPALQAMLPGLRQGSVGQLARDALAAYPELLGLIEGETSEVIELQIPGAGPGVVYQGKLSPMLDGRKRVIGNIVSLHDYTETRQLLGQLEDLATRDGLTGVYNRRHFGDLAQREMARIGRYGGSFALIILDLDHFKRVNDVHGHAAGDMALKAVAELCCRLIRRSDVFGRLGGEEFAVFLPETGPEAAAGMAERLRQAIERQPISCEGRPISVTASFGIFGAASSAGVTLEDLFRYADQALYAAKESGRNRVSVWQPEFS